jgi:diketogulonate reductase-like aldo/keto reductase
MPTLGETIEAWKVMAQFQDEGKVRMIGLSNCYDKRVIVELSKIRAVQVVQNRWYEGNGWDREVQSYCLEHGIQYQ